MKNILIASFFMLSILLNSGCEKDSPDLPASELILGQWKWVRLALKVVSAEGETLSIISQSLPANAYVKFEAPNVFHESEDGIIVEQFVWTLDITNQIVTIQGIEYKILRLDQDYLILGRDVWDPITQKMSRSSIIYQR